MSRLGDFLKKTRIGLGFSLKDIENISGVSNSYLSQIENGKRTDPHPNILKKLAPVYEVDVLQLLKYADYLEFDDDEVRRVKNKREVAKWFKKLQADEKFYWSFPLNYEIEEEAIKAMLVDLYKSYLDVVNENAKLKEENSKLKSNLRERGFDD